MIACQNHFRSKHISRFTSRRPAIGIVNAIAGSAKMPDEMDSPPPLDSGWYMARASGLSRQGTGMLSARSFAVSLFLCSCILSIVSVSALANGQHCDPMLRQDLRYQLGYRQRGDRCEGVYIRNVDSGMLDIVSFTMHFADFDLQSATAVPLIWYCRQSRWQSTCALAVCATGYTTAWIRSAQKA